MAYVWMATVSPFESFAESLSLSYGAGRYPYRKALKIMVVSSSKTNAAQCFHFPFTKAAFVSLLFLMILSVFPCFAAPVDLGNGFLDHGVAVPISHSRGTVATVDGQGRNIVLVWLFDHRGGYALLLIDVQTGNTEMHPMPFPTGGDSPYASILSSRNKFYTHFGSYFCEFDPVKRAFTFFRKTTPQMAMSMTEDDQGMIWSATYPQSGVVSFHPQTGEFRDYGSLHKEKWEQYPRTIAADNAGWIYWGIGTAASQIFSLDPLTGLSKPMFAEANRRQGYASVYRDRNGRVYGRLSENAQEEEYEFYKGEKQKKGKRNEKKQKFYIASTQALFHKVFPDGTQLADFNLAQRFLTVFNPKIHEKKKISFDYKSEGANIVSVATCPDKTICGGVWFPMYFFRYSPGNHDWMRHAAYGQFNTLGRNDTRLYVGGYPEGFLLEWNPKREWTGTVKGKRDSNPLCLATAEPIMNRPHKLLVHPGGRWIIVAGTPGYGYTGGGLLFWDTKTQTSEIMKDIDILPDQSTYSLVALPKNKLLGGSTVHPGTGGERKAKQAELYILDMDTRKIDWRGPVFPGAQTYTDLYRVKNGMVFGIVDCRRLFVFDPARRKVVYEDDLPAKYGSLSSGGQQGPRVFISGPDKTVYVLMRKAIARLDQDTYQLKILAESPVIIESGGDYLEGRIYFGSGSHVYSYGIRQ